MLDIVILAVPVGITMDRIFLVRSAYQRIYLISNVYHKSTADSNDNDLEQYGHLHLGLDTVLRLIIVN